MSEAPVSRPDWPAAFPELNALRPFVYSVWADGVLAAAEVDAFRRFAEDRLPVGEAAMDALIAWLDPNDPPSAVALRALARSMRAADVGDRERACASLSDLGLALARASAPEGSGSGEDAEVALRALETELGLPGREAARRAMGLRVERPTPAPPAPGFDVETLRAYLDRPSTEIRARVRELLLQPALRVPLGLPTEEYRERVLGALQELASEGVGALAYPVAYGGRDDRAASLAAFETLAYGDLSVLVKFGVQFGLFGGSVLQLGTEKHHERYLPKIASLDLPGCYAMTETGHGSNVRDLVTTATYDSGADELVVTTPDDAAAKDWIGNAARHGRLATVFARLVVDEVDHGVHAILVPLRDDAGRTLPGVRIEDRGLKEGLNGVDNGRIWFDSVRVPRDSLLDRFGSIDQTGAYSSPIPSPGRRFFTMLGTLVAGRVCIGAASVTAAKVGLTTAIRYTATRVQFGPDGGPEQPLLDYLALQRALLPHLATTFAAHFTARALQVRYADPADDDDAALEVDAAALKAYASEACVETLQVCREACGGQGYLAENRFAALKADTDVFTTFEGANLVLYQLVTKGLLSKYRDEMGDLSLWGAVRYLAERAETRLTELNPVATRRTDREHLVDSAFHTAAFRYREERLLRSLAGRLRHRLGRGMDTFNALNEVQDHAVELARAYAERLFLEHGLEGVTHAPSPGLSEALNTVMSLYALSRIEANAASFLEWGYLDPPKARAVRSAVNTLCADVRECALLLVDGFGVPAELLPEIARH